VESRQLAQEIVEILEDMKGENIVLIDLEKIAMFTSYFVICSGTSDRMLSALAGAVVDRIHDHHDLKAKPQGDPSSGWVVVDYGGVIVHCFGPETREFYKLEELWKEGKVLVRIQ
jgi:ribosome-associated protein